MTRYRTNFPETREVHYCHGKERTMNKRHLCTLTQRLNRLERENRWWKLVGFVTVAALGVIVLMGATQSKVADEVRARKFVVVDNEGRVRGTLGMKKPFSFLGLSDEPTALLELADSDQKLRVQLRGSGGGAGLDFFDSRGRSLMRLYLTGGEGYYTPALALGDENDKTGITLGFEPDINYNRFPITISKPVIYLWDKNRNIRARFIVSAEGEPALRLYDDNGKIRAVLGSTNLETVRTEVVEKRPASSLVMFNKDGKVIWSAP